MEFVTWTENYEEARRQYLGCMIPEVSVAFVCQPKSNVPCDVPWTSPVHVHYSF